ncbi:inositol phosphosphingolipid phospholipase [Sugiyamaella lignohabitans]|uniref:Inositol phosphosphingolipid phospholipase n=1 Tax=Sugiyamaella lignohabitans TaxID=796027 RepID=A0A167FEM2_9ASCO|nr:inositol phosphosphingolipid phospholipase [Sugiyamaella lignohabitans]ANB15203.1 inositol phosphosphingolipid phospholipase [Sugiyamaella lignohabitans]
MQSHQLPNRDEKHLARVLSLNCWGLKYVSKFRTLRINGIASKLADQGHKYDIVALQEIWVEDDFKVIRDSLEQHLPYSKLYYSGILSGPGLAVFSRWPLIDASVFRYPLNGRPSAFFRGDWYVGKSVASAIIRHPSGQNIELLSSHMHAPYGEGDAAYTCHRTAQAWELARIARRSRECGHLTIVVGDLNSIPGSASYDLLQLVGRLSDSWTSKHGEFTGDIALLSTEDQILLAGATCDSVYNTWRADRQAHEAKRLDYILFDSSRAYVDDCRVSFTERVEGMSFSDHFAIESDLIIKPILNPHSVSGVEKIQPNISEALLVNSVTDDDLLTLYNKVLSIIDDYKPTSVWQKKIRIYHFWLSIFILIALMIAVFWGALKGRTYFAFIFILLSILVTATGLIDGLIGFLFGRNETRALMEFESEIRLAMATLG